MFNEAEVLLRLLLAGFAGGLIGFEREKHGRTAGLRTHILVCTGSCLMTLVSQYIPIIYKGVLETADPGRIAAQIVTGIGFIGAGTIMRERFGIRGLTTAASLWVAAGIGLALGSGLYKPAILVVIISLFTLFVLNRIERWIKKDWYNLVSIITEDKKGQIQRVEEVLENLNAKIEDLTLERSLDKGEILIKAQTRFRGKFSQRKPKEGFLDKLIEIEGVKKVIWE